MKNYLQAVILVLSFALAGFAFAESVDINSADAQTIAANVKGIGLIKATAIVNYREKNGSFHSLDELTKVKGIGQNIIEKNKHLLTINQE